MYITLPRSTPPIMREILVSKLVWSLMRQGYKVIILVGEALII